MFKKILIPIDPSHTSAAARAIDVAQHLQPSDGEIILLSVIEEIPSYVAGQIPSEVLDKAQNETRKNLEKLSSSYKSKATLLVERGHPASTIKSVQKDQDCDLIIISSHKPTTVDYLLGSTAAKVVRRAPCPVFVLR